ncbi:MAG: hypothetical protein LBD23_05545 [Oscillospiraceae bacterium]|nr:hypothetical protein [Oscillospiraceae bacterium]
MVIQSYDVKTSSERTFLSVQSTTMQSTRNIRAPQNMALQNARQAPTSASATPAQEDTLQLTKQQRRHHPGGLEDGHFKRMYKNNTDESIRQLARGAGSQRRANIRGPQKTSTKKTGAQKTAAKKTGTQKASLPGNPDELRAHMMRLLFDLLLGRNGNTGTSFQISGNTGVHSTEISGLFSGADGVGTFNAIEIGSFASGSIAFGNFSLDDSVPRLQIVDGWRIEQFEFESEQVSYQAQGVVKTADGRTINVDISMFMSRQFTSYMGINVETARPIDPLVINYGGTAASLLDEKFQFDLTMDGSLDSLSVLGEGSGFLAIDWNGDRKINDGSQLFGPSSGCGFSELRKYDTDGNGWIDANDEIFDKLVVWHRDKDGNDTVHTLKELGIGAIFLGDIATEFSFKGDSNETLGVMRSTSFFLMQCGGAGTVSHIDMMV